MAKKPTRRKTTKKKKKTTAKRKPRTVAAARDATGKQLVIVESPAKAKTINQYLGSDYIVEASIGHVRDLPPRAPKGSKQPVPGVDLDNDFAPTYEVLPAKKTTLNALKKAAKAASEVWFATDLDREGEAIAWHLAQEMGINPAKAKRVIFNAITKSQITQAFENPHTIDLYKVNAQQARRILDRIVGYQVSPLLWKKVARGLSAGRVQSVAVRLIVDREREIDRFIPSESWRVTGRFSLEPDAARGLERQWAELMARTDAKGKGPTLKMQNAWLAEHQAIKGELIKIDGAKFELTCTADDPQDLTDRAREVAEAAGLINISTDSVENPGGRGPAQWHRTVTGVPDPAARYRVTSITTKRTRSKAPAPFVTASLQAAAASSLGFAAQRTMRLAQSLYEGVQIRGEGQVGLITYMRTDSTHLAPEAIQEVRDYVGKSFGPDYLPKSVNLFDRGKGKAQEAHEAIRPTDPRRDPERLGSALNDDQKKLYRLIWSRFVACQMAPAEWDGTTALLERSDRDTGCVFRTTGRVLVFDGWYRVAGVQADGDEQLLPDLTEGRTVAPFSIDPEQLFNSPPPRYSEASLVKALESEGIGRPSTYASIIQVIQDRNYVEQMDRRFYATDLGEVVTDKLIEAFPRLMETSYTRGMEEELDKIEEQHTDWVTMLRNFYSRFSKNLEEAHETLTHAKAEIQPAAYMCPECGRQTCYRFGKNGRFLSCTGYPECNYAAPINREGRPMLPERVDVACPVDGSQMVLRRGRFGPFLASVNYPDVDFVINVDKKGHVKHPAPPPYETDLECPKCQSSLYLRRGARGPWLGCSTFPKCRGRLAWTSLEDSVREDLENKLEAHEKANPAVKIATLAGQPIPKATPVTDLVIPGGVADLKIHPDAQPNTKSA